MVIHIIFRAFVVCFILIARWDVLWVAINFALAVRQEISSYSYSINKALELFSPYCLFSDVIHYHKCIANNETAVNANSSK